MLAQDDWWKHILEIGFHIHPEDATQANKEMILKVCKDYGKNFPVLVLDKTIQLFFADIIEKSYDCDSLVSVNSNKQEKKELLLKLINMFTDAYFKVGTLDTAQLVAKNNVPVFQYR